MSSNPTAPLFATLIRAPLSINTSSSSSGSELDPLSGSEDDSDGGFSSEPEPEPEPTLAAAAAEAGSGLIPVARATNDDGVAESEESFDEVDGDGFSTAARVSAPLNEEADEEYPSLDEAEDEKIKILGFVEREGGMGLGVNDVDEVGVLVKTDDNVDDEAEDSFDEVDGDGFPTAARVSVPLDDEANDKDKLLVEGLIEDGIGMKSNERDLIFDVGISGFTAEENEAIVEGGIGPEAVEWEEDAVEADLNFEELEADASDAEETGRVLDEDEKVGTLAETDSDKNEILSFDDAVVEGDMIPDAMAAEINDVKIEEGEDLKIEVEVVKSNADEDEEGDRVIVVDPNSEEHHEEFGVYGEDHSAKGNDEEVGVLEENLSAGSISEIDGLLSGRSNLLVDTRVDESVECKLDSSQDEIGAENEDIDAPHEEDESSQRGSEEMSSIIEGEMGLKTLENKPNVLELVKDGIAGEFEQEEVECSSVEAEKFGHDKNYKPCGLIDNILEVDESFNCISASADNLKISEDFQKTFDANIDGSTTTTISNAKVDGVMTEEEKKFHEEVESIRVKFLRIVHRLGRSSDDNVVASVLYHLARAEDVKDWLYSFSSARIKALELEMGQEKDKLNFSCNILVIGKAGVGKSATINSIFEEDKSATNPFKAETMSVRKIQGEIDGIKIQILDTPGFRPSALDQPSNRRVLSSIKKCMKKCPPDVILYVDRLDAEDRDFNDLPLLRSITKTLGPSIWSKAIIALSHAAAAPPEGPTGQPFSFEEHVDLRYHLVQHLICKSVGDVSLMNQVVLVENGEGHRLLPDGSSWISELLLLCYSSKILSEANSLCRAKNSVVRKTLVRLKSPPLPLFLYSLLESKVHPKQSSEIDGNMDFDADLDGLYSDEENEEDEYDQLPSFHPLTKSQISKLSKEHRRAYIDEYDYRVKLFQRKLWKQEIRRLKEIKRKGNTSKDFKIAQVTSLTPLPDMALPPSFDSDDPVYRFRALEKPNSGPIMDPHAWDHDCGFNSVSIDKALHIAAKVPAAISVELKKDKEEFSIQMDSSISVKHKDSGSTLASFDINSNGDRLACCFRGEASFMNTKKNRATAGFSVNFFGDNVATGLKLEDRVSIGKAVNLALTGGVVQAEGNIGYGAILEATLKDKDYHPTGQSLATLGLSLVSYHRNLVFGGALQSQLSVGRNSNLSIRAGINNKKSGQITVTTSSSSEQLQIILLGLVPVVTSIFRRIWHTKSSSE